MKALILDKDGPQLINRPWPQMDGEVVIRPLLAGICATDLELVKGYMGFAGVLGHEFVGVVESAPDSNPRSEGDRARRPRRQPRSWLGRRVVGEINCPCGSCVDCQKGRGNHCSRRTVLGIQGRDGVFGDALRLPLANLHVVPDEVSNEAAVFVEPLAAACRILEQVQIQSTDRVIVIGVGRLGQLVARVLSLTGAEVFGVSKHQSHLDLLPSSVVPTIDTKSLPRADVVVDCSGSPGGLALAVSLVRPLGTVVLKTTTHRSNPPNPTSWVIDEVQVVGSRCGPFGPALRLLANGLVDPTPLISLQLPLVRGVEALKRAAEPDVLKVLLHFDA
ncbi:MAG: alcohol dehydrogenase catalytic domain-containing protein [Proteobacteria bacterium]|jgi:threonine dehydrogenase-like Zn-dependent dehydrogenase|nr:alcohol dehydrogenase catalytic domain-containing protein [Pseudomonadota bacterium]